MALNFKTSKPVTPGCNYVVVNWFVGGFPVIGATSKKRNLVSCHRTSKAARSALHAAMRKQKESLKPFMKRMGMHKTLGRPRVAAYNVKTGKRMKV